MPVLHVDGKDACGVLNLVLPEYADLDVGEAFLFYTFLSQIYYLIALAKYFAPALTSGAFLEQFSPKAFLPLLPGYFHQT